MHSFLALDASVWTAFGVGFTVAVLFLRAAVNYRAIPSIYPANNRALPDCMVVIPARNEELFIERAVQSFPHDTVIVVDDHSEDRTAEVARKAGAGVLPAPDLPRGAVGKSNACIAGARALTSKWILFIDGDTRVEPGFLEAAIASADSMQVAFLSIYLRPEVVGLSEHLLVPYAVALYFCGMNPASNPVAAFNGQCLLVRRDAYEFLGGHAAVKGSFVEDVKLAALAKRHRLTFGLARSDLGYVRFREPSAAFVRAAFRFIPVSPWIGVTILIAAGTAALWLPVLLWLILRQEWTAAIAFGVLPFFATVFFYRGLLALFAPIAIYGMLPILLRGLIAALSGRQIVWKGREI